MRIVKIWFALSLVLAISMSLQAKKVRLKYNFEKGTVFSCEYVVTQDITQEVMGQSQSTHSMTTQVMEFKVINIDADGNYRMVSKMTGIKARMSSPNGDIELNSDDIIKGDGPLKFMRWMLEDTVTFVMSPQGEVLSIESAEALIEKYKNLQASAEPEVQMLASIGSQFLSEDALKQNISMLFFKFPEKKVKIGKPWESVSELNRIISFNATMNQTVTGLEPGAVSLSQQTKFEQADPDVTSLVQGMTMRYKLSGSKKAEYQFDPHSGLTISGEGTGSIDGVMSIESPQLQTPMSIPITIKRVDRISLIK